MPAASDVTPQRWSSILVLFDNGWYSLVAGEYRNDDGTTEPHAIGERWNGRGEEIGFPNVSGHPVWHVVPGFLEVPVLHGLLDELMWNPNEQRPERGLAKGTEATTRTQRVLGELANRPRQPV